MDHTRMPSSPKTVNDETRRRIAAEKRRVAREQHLARLTPEQRANLGKGLAEFHGVLSEEDGEIFERALRASRTMP